jgi:hypothetical protein
LPATLVVIAIALPPLPFLSPATLSAIAIALATLVIAHFVPTSLIAATIAHGGAVYATSFATHLGGRGLVLEYNLVIKDYYLKVRGLNERSRPCYF